MKKKGNEVRKKMIVIRMNQQEFESVEKLRKQSREKNLSTYVRKITLQKPVAITYRNQSADDFLKEMVGLKKELSGIGNNFNQAVHKLHLLEKIPEFRIWIYQNDQLQKLLIAKVEEIRSRMNQLYEQWLQK